MIHLNDTYYKNLVFQSPSIVDRNMLPNGIYNTLTGNFGYGKFMSEMSDVMDEIIEEKLNIKHAHKSIKDKDGWQFKAWNTLYIRFISVASYPVLKGEIL